MKCPKCKSDISSLDYTATIIHRGTFNGEFEEGPADYLNEGEYTFECPSCGEELFNNIADAEELLNKTEEQNTLK